MPPGDSDLPPLPQALSTSESTQMVSAVDTNTNINTNAATTFAGSDGLNVTDAWLITGSLAPRSQPAGWPLHSPSNLITSAPRMASPLPENFSQTLNPPFLESGQTQSPQPYNLSQTIIPVPKNVDQTPYQFADDFSGTSSSAPQDLGQVMGSMSRTFTQIMSHLADISRTSHSTPQDLGQVMGSVSRNFAQITNHLAGMSRISSPLPQDFRGQIMSPVPQHTGATMNYLTHQPSRTGSPLPQDYSRTGSPLPQDHSRTGSPLPQDYSRTGSPLPQDYSRTGSPLRDYSRMTGAVPEDFSQTMSPFPYELSRTSSPVPQGYHSPMPQALPQATSPLPAYWSATQAPATSDLGTTQSPMPHGVNQTTDRSSKPSASFNFLVAAQIEPDSPGDFTVQDSAVVSDSEVAPDTPSQSTLATTKRKRKLSHSMASRPLQASNRNLMPSYPVKESKKFPNQMRAID